MTLSIFVSTRLNGSMKSVHVEDLKDINQSRATFLSEKGVDPGDTTLVRLTYDRDDYLRYFSVDRALRGDGIVRDSTITSDALVVTKPNHALFLPLADCIGAVIYDPEKNILMVSHLGRHNLEQYGGIKSIEYLVGCHAVDPSKLQVWLSPAASKDVYPLFAFNNRSLHDVAVEQLCDAGVSMDNIDTSPIDSAKDKMYYSHSQHLKGVQSDDGRFAIVAVLTDS